MALGNRKNVVENQVEETVIESTATPVQQQAAEPTPQTQPAATPEPQAEPVIESTPVQVEPVQQPEASQAPAIVQTSAPAPAQQHGVAQMMHDMAEEGFDGLELDYSSFVGISLDGETFATSEEDDIDGREGFVVQFQRSRTKYALRSNDARAEDVEVAYTYIKNDHLTPGTASFEKVKEWEKEGRGLGEVKKYTEIWALMIDDGSMGGELNDQLVSLSIPPTSRGRLSGLIAREKMRTKRGPGEYLIRCTAGKKVKKAKFPFHPWAFKIEE